MNLKKRLLSTLVSALVVAPMIAGAGTNDDLNDKFFSKKKLRLTPQEVKALSIAKKWKAGKGMKPTAGRDGAIKFVYGVQQPSVICAVLQVCDIALQPGELVNSINLGDPARWTVDPAITGSGQNEVQHLIIKPLDVGLDTSLAVSTNRRSYHIKLRSDRHRYMPFVSFSYPEESLAKWEALKKRESHDRERKVMPHTGESIDSLNFDYEVSGSASWKPVRVYNDGKKTYIEMPKAMQQTESPALVVVRKEGGLFSDDKTVMINYRVHGDRYIVDAVFDKAILVAGVGGDQDRITITKEGK